MSKKDWQLLKAYQATGLTPVQVAELQRKMDQAAEDLEVTKAAMAAGIAAAGQDRLCDVCAQVCTEWRTAINFTCEKCVVAGCPCRTCVNGSNFVWLGPDGGLT